MIAADEGTAVRIDPDDFAMECFFFLVASIANTNASFVLVLYELIRRPQLAQDILLEAEAVLSQAGGVWSDAVRAVTCAMLMFPWDFVRSAPWHRPSTPCPCCTGPSKKRFACIWRPCTRALQGAVRGPLLSHAGCCFLERHWPCLLLAKPKRPSAPSALLYACRFKCWHVAPTVPRVFVCVCACVVCLFCDVAGSRKDLQVGDVFIPKGRVIAVPTYLQHMDPALYPNPTVFDPRRTERKEGRGLNYLAFGGGGHKCLGLRLAEMELCIGIVELLRKYDVSIVGGTADEALHPLKMRTATLGYPLPPYHLSNVKLTPKQPTAAK